MNATLQKRYLRRLAEETAAMRDYDITPGTARLEHLRRSKRLRSRVFRMNSLLWGSDAPAHLPTGPVITL
jgi:hypothetical protein